MGILRYARVAGYGSKYTVFEDGTVWSDKGFRFLKLQRQKKKNGLYYVYVRLCKDGKARKHYIHRLVAACFLPNPEDKPTVNHKDGNGENNKLSNLEWSTMREQVAHAWSTNLTDTSGSKCATSKLSGEDVAKIRQLKQAGRTQVSIANEFGVGTSQISRILTGQSWHRG